MGDSYDKTIDIWSLGCIVYQMFFGDTPFVGYSEEEIQEKMIKGDYKIHRNVTISLAALDFINSCL